MADPFLSEIRLFGGTFAPRDWMLCNGQLLAIAENQALFSLIGTLYGGDGITTFALPDLRNRTPVGVGQGPGLIPRAQGDAFGAAEVTLAVANLPAHTHPLVGSVVPATTPNPSNAAPAGGLDATFGGPPDGELAGLDSTGRGMSVSNQPPTLWLTFIICTAGLFPQRA